MHILAKKGCANTNYNPVTGAKMLEGEKKLCGSPIYAKRGQNLIPKGKNKTDIPSATSSSIDPLTCEKHHWISPPLPATST